MLTVLGVYGNVVTRYGIMTTPIQFRFSNHWEGHVFTFRVVSNIFQFEVKIPKFDKKAKIESNIYS